MWKWSIDVVADDNYNVVGAFEIMLINIGIVRFEDQWDIDEIEKYCSNIKNCINAIESYAEEFDGDKLRYDS